MIDLGGGGAAAITLSEVLSPALVNAVVHATPDHVFVGLNAAEWGGGLRQIDRRTGRVTTRERMPPASFATAR